MKILVTGAAGFIGGHLVDRLINEGHNVWGIDNCSTGEPHFNVRAIYVFLDLSHSVTEISDYIKFQRFDAIYHLAAIARVQPSIQDPQRYYSNNVNSTLNLLEACRLNEFKGKIVFTSSSSVYNGIRAHNISNSEYLDKTVAGSPYALSKIHCEELCRYYSEHYGLNISIARPFNVYGPRMAHGGYSTVLQTFLDNYRDKKPLIIYGDGSQRRDFTFVSDIIQGLLLLGNDSYSGCSIFNIGSGKNYSIKEIADLFPCKKIYMEKRDEPENTLANISRLKDLGYQPEYNVLEWIKTQIE